LVNTDPYGKGWFFKMKLSNPDEAKNLKDSKGYTGLIGG
jgi:glycine cleavage system H protein